MLIESFNLLWFLALKVVAPIRSENVFQSIFCGQHMNFTIYGAVCVCEEADEHREKALRLGKGLNGSG
jgi:hypothetical protein